MDSGKDQNTFGPHPGPPSPHFPMPQRLPPSSPPASPPRTRQPSNSISESIAEDRGEGTRYQSVEEKARLLQSNVLRAYPPPVSATLNPSKRRKVTPPQQRIVVPPSPPESLIINRQYRSASTATSATARTMPVLEEGEDSTPAVPSLRDRLGRALTYRRGTHSRKPSSTTSLEVPSSAGGGDIGKLTLITTYSPQVSTPQSAQASSANTENLSALTTAHTSLYSHTFPIPDILPEIKSQGSRTESQSSYALPTYYDEQVSRGSSQCLPERPNENQSAGYSVDGDRGITIKGGEVRVEIRRPAGKEIVGGGYDVVRLSEGSKAEPSSGMRSRHPSWAGAEESGFGKGRGRAGDEPEGDDSAELIGLGIRTRRAFSNLRSQARSPEAQTATETDVGDGDESEDFRDTVRFFERLGMEDSSYPRRMKSALPYAGSDSVDEQNRSARKWSDRRQEDVTGKLSPAKSSSSVLIESSLSSPNMRSQSSLSGGRSMRAPSAGGRNQSSSSNSAKCTAALRPAFGRSLTGQTNLSIDTTSSPIAIDDVEGMVRTMSEELSKRLSALSSSGGSIGSSQGKVGAGIAVVVTAENDGSISGVRGGLVSINDEEYEGGEEAEDEEEEEEDDYSSVDNRSNKLRPDKGKRREIPESIGGTSTGDTKDESEGKTGTSPYPSDVGGVKVEDFQDKGGFLIHPGDERYDFVYHMRSASPDNQPILVPFYQTSPPGSFPYRNALPSSVPQKITKVDQRTPSMSNQGFLERRDISGLPGQPDAHRSILVSDPEYSGEAKQTSSTNEKVSGARRSQFSQLVFPFGGLSSKQGKAHPEGIEMTGQIDGAGGKVVSTETRGSASNGQPSNLKAQNEGFVSRVSKAATWIITPKKRSSTYMLEGTAQILEGDSFADNSSPGFNRTSKVNPKAVLRQVKRYSEMDAVIDSPARVRLRQRNYPEIPSPMRRGREEDDALLPKARTPTPAPQEFPSSPPFVPRAGEVHVQVPPDILISDYEELHVTPSQQDANDEEHNKETRNAITEYKRELLSTTPDLPGEGTGRATSTRLTQGTVQGVGYLSTGDRHDTVISQQSTRSGSRLGSGAGGEFRRLSQLSLSSYDAERQRRFSTPPHIFRPRPYHEYHSGLGIIPSHPKDLEAYDGLDAETLALQKKHSRVLLFLCCIFPPMLIIFAYGGMDAVILNMTAGKVARVGVTEKRIAFFLGTFLMCACVSIAVIMGILSSVGAL